MWPQPVTLTIMASPSACTAPQVFGGRHLLIPMLRVDCHLLWAVITFSRYVRSILYWRAKQAPMVAFTCVCKINISAPTVKSIFCWDYLLVIWETSLEKCRGSCSVLLLPVHLSSVRFVRSMALLSGVQSGSGTCWHLYNGPGRKHEKQKVGFSVPKALPLQYASLLITSLLFPPLDNLALMRLSSADLFLLLFHGDMTSVKTEKEVQNYLNSFCFDIVFLVMGFLEVKRLFFFHTKGIVISNFQVWLRL